MNALVSRRNVQLGQIHSNIIGSSNEISVIRRHCLDLVIMEVVFNFHKVSGSRKLQKLKYDSVK